MSWTTLCANDASGRTTRYAQGGTALCAQVLAFPTLCAFDANGTRTLPEGTTPTGRRPDGRKAQIGLPNAVLMAEAFPTLTVQDGEVNGGPSQFQRNTLPHSAEVLKREWPTLTVNGNNNRAGLTAKSGDGLATAVKADTLDRCKVKLSARWSTRFMGYPDGWLDVDAEPAPKVDPRWPDGDPLEAFASWDTIPRVVTQEARRAARIRALGNAVVPQLPFILISAIVKQEAA